MDLINALKKKSFNPRTYIRYDSRSRMFVWPERVFQSTYLYKVRPPFVASLAVGVGFNPRTYIRYDSPFFQKLHSRTVSIHVPI